jgi:hypothetical protein
MNGGRQIALHLFHDLPYPFGYLVDVSLPADLFPPPTPPSISLHVLPHRAELLPYARLDVDRLVSLYPKVGACRCRCGWDGEEDGEIGSWEAFVRLK